MAVHPHYIATLLVEQPTWGGEYIAEFKGVTNPEVTTKKIGQGFELAKDSMLTPSLGDAMPFGFAPVTDLAHPVWQGDTSSLISIQDWINQNPLEILGKRGVEKLGSAMNVLIKFTQAKNNSYQVHVKPGAEFGTWQAKPESWYYLETGKATLGLAPGADVNEYQARCLKIDAQAQALSQKVKTGQLTVHQARHQLQAFIDQDHPRRFVNTVTTAKDAIIDLSQGGIHHSWEVGPEAPLGNIVYEVQVDVRDEFCTLRSFDQGNIKDDGSVRPLGIEDYFKALDSDPQRNLPELYSSTAAAVTEGSAQVTALFDNQYYQTTKVNFFSTYQGQATQLNDSFHHVFALTNDIVIKTTDGEWSLNKGWGIVIPAKTGSYSLTATGSAEVLITSV